MVKYDNSICTQEAFHHLIKTTKPNTICDIGSRDCSEASIFSKLNEDATVYAFEAHPDLCDVMKKKYPHIHSENYAISDKDGTATFFITDQDNNCGSLLENNDSSNKSEFTVSTKRLDNILTKVESNEKIALWIDTEGCTYEVLSGSEHIIKNIAFIHSEIETKPLWDGQKTLDQVDQIMNEFGFERVLTNLTEEVSQGNALYINKNTDIKSVFESWQQKTSLKNKITYALRTLKLDKISPKFFQYLRKVYRSRM